MQLYQKEKTIVKPNYNMIPYMYVTVEGVKSYQSLFKLFDFSSKIYNYILLSSESFKIKKTKLKEKT